MIKGLAILLLLYCSAVQNIKFSSLIFLYLYSGFLMLIFYGKNDFIDGFITGYTTNVKGNF